MKSTRHLICCLLLCSVIVFAGSEIKKPTENLSIYVDTQLIDFDYFRTEIPYLNYSVKRDDADIHLQIDTIGTGSGGTEYRIHLFGRGCFINRDIHVTYLSEKNDPLELTRSGLIKKIKFGLMGYLIDSNMASDFNLVYTKKLTSSAPSDSWNNWLFSLSLATSFSGSNNRSDANIYGGVDISRVTEKSKFFANLNYRYSKSTIEKESEEISKTKKSFRISSAYIHSVAEKFSLGGFVSYHGYDSSSITNSIRLALVGEYSFLPYSLAPRKEFLLNYTLGGSFLNFNENVSAGEWDSSQLYHQFLLYFNQYSRWGSYNLTLSGMQYFEEMSNYRLQFSTTLSFKLKGGFFFDIDGHYSYIKNVESLSYFSCDPSSQISAIISNGSQYNYRLSVGLRFLFGSKTNNVVNPRIRHW